MISTLIEFYTPIKNTVTQNVKWTNETSQNGNHHGNRHCNRHSNRQFTRGWRFLEKVHNFQANSTPVQYNESTSTATRGVSVVRHIAEGANDTWLQYVEQRTSFVVVVARVRHFYISNALQLCSH